MTTNNTDSAAGVLTDEQIKHMVDRFLGWRLPDTFSPDAGISFKLTFNDHLPTGPMKNQPSGTNLFDAEQAKAMVLYMIEGLAAASTQPPADLMSRCLELEELATAHLSRMAPALSVLRAMLAKEGLAGVDVADELLADTRALLAAARTQPAEPFATLYADGYYTFAPGRAVHGCNEPGWEMKVYDGPQEVQQEPSDLDAVRFRLLTEDIGDSKLRAARNKLLERMPTMSYNAVCQQIDAMLEEFGLTLAAPLAAQQEPDDDLKVTSGPLLELDVLLAAFHAAVWKVCQGDDDSNRGYDEAGVEEAKAIQRHVRAMIAAPHAADSATTEEVDAQRYRRLRILGAATGGSAQLEAGHVLRFQSLDAYLDADLVRHESRGEFSGESTTAAPADQAGEREATCMCSGLGPCERPGDVSCRIARTAPAVTAATAGETQSLIGWRQKWPSYHETSGFTPWSAAFSDYPTYIEEIMRELRARGAICEPIYGVSSAPAGAEKLTNEQLDAFTKERFGNMNSMYCESFRRLMRTAIDADRALLAARTADTPEAS